MKAVVKMTIEKLEEFLNEGEGYTLEYKESVNSLSDSVFETVSSFSNRYGGYILLGIKEVKRGNKKSRRGNRRKSGKGC